MTRLPAARERFVDVEIGGEQAHQKLRRSPLPGRAPPAGPARRSSRRSPRRPPPPAGARGPDTYLLRQHDGTFGKVQDGALRRIRCSSATSVSWRCCSDCATPP